MGAEEARAPTSGRRKNKCKGSRALFNIYPPATKTISLQHTLDNISIQWMPSHCNVPDDEEADRLEKSGRSRIQEGQEVMCEEVETIVKDKQRRLW